MLSKWFHDFTLFDPSQQVALWSVATCLCKSHDFPSSQRIFANLIEPVLRNKQYSKHGHEILEFQPIN